MSKAVICDKCGRILPYDGKYHPIWDMNPFMSTQIAEAAIHLCDECYEQFKTDFLKNLSEEAR